MTNHGYKFIDPDLHVYEPSDLWTRYIEPGFRDQAPVAAMPSSATCTSCTRAR